MNDEDQKSNRLSVSQARWQEAQEWEQAYWKRAQRRRSRFGKNIAWRLLSTLGLKEKHRGDDWNLWWDHQFAGYDFLPEAIDNAIELGCGPYTNFRRILRRCRPRHLVLSDPLIRTYTQFKLTFVADMYRQGACMLDDHPIEETPFAPGYFDLVVLINVLDHVRDAEACTRKAADLTKPGGFLVLGQDLTNAEDLQAMTDRESEIGHPIKISHEDLDARLGPAFEPVLRKVLRREEGRAPTGHYGTYVFAGRKR